MTTYLWIGLIVQSLIIIARMARGVARVEITSVLEGIGFAIGFVIIMTINIVIWPLTFVCEIINTIQGK